MCSHTVSETTTCLTLAVQHKLTFVQVAYRDHVVMIMK